MNVIELLQQLGFSEYEARAYVALLQRYPANGATVAKGARIPRANVYAALQKLEDRGAAVRVETEDGITYAPIPPDELFQHLSTRFEATLDAARHALLPVAAVEDSYVQNIQGQGELLRHAHDLIGEASKELLIANWQAEAQALAQATADAQTRDVAFTTLCFQACAEACPHCRQPVYRYQITVSDYPRWLILVRDNTEMVIGTIDAQQTIAIRTKQQRLIEMTSWYIRHSIAVAALLTDLGADLVHQVKPNTQAVWASLVPGAGWLQSVLALIKR
jgi:HTH-type transcriptional regulator, sugar sensing transcriptional regulator